MQTVILAAGKGTRMGDMTKHSPKPMLRVAGKPLLDYKIRYLPDSIREVVLVVEHQWGEIQEYFGDSFSGKKIKYVVNDSFGGTGEALHSAKRVLEGKFLVLMGDDLYSKADLERMLLRDIAVLGFRAKEDGKFGIIDVDEFGRMRNVFERYETKRGGLINAGAYVLNESFFSYPLVRLENGELGLPQTLAQMAVHCPIEIINAIDWFPISTPPDMLAAEVLVSRFYPNG